MCSVESGIVLVVEWAVESVLEFEPVDSEPVAPERFAEAD